MDGGGQAGAAEETEEMGRGGPLTEARVTVVVALRLALPLLLPFHTPDTAHDREEAHSDHRRVSGSSRRPLRLHREEGHRQLTGPCEAAAQGQRGDTGGRGDELRAGW